LPWPWSSDLNLQRANRSTNFWKGLEITGLNQAESGPKNYLHFLLAIQIEKTHPRVGLGQGENDE
jgi:hypothetical protein